MPHLSLHSPIGDLTVFEDADAIVAIDWGWAPGGNGSPLLHRARDQLDAYFDGALRDFDLPLALQGTPYQRRVRDALCAIPYGETRTYADIARAAGGGARSVGQANGRNPIPIVVPCHRVVASAHLGGYSGDGALETKRWLLALEGAAPTLL